MSVILVILLAGTSLSSNLDNLDQVAAPSSHWASVYSSDTTDYREPVRDQVYPLVKDVSRSDWFNSYPYHKFEERKEEKAEEQTGILENVAKAVGSVRQKITDFGDDVVNSALGLVGAGQTDDGYEERDGPQSLASSPHEREELSVDGNTVRPAFVQPDPVSPIEQFRLGVRSYLDPLVDPMVDPIKRFFKSEPEQDHERKQNIFPSPIAAMSDFGKRVAGGFSKLSRLSSPSKVSSVLFPWLNEADEATTEVSSLLARSQTELLSEAGSSPHAQYLPLLPPVFIPPVPAPDQQVSHPTNTDYHQHTQPQPRHPLDILGLVKRPQNPPNILNWPTKEENARATIIVNPPAVARTEYSVSSLSDLSDRQPLSLLISPIVSAALRRKKAEAPPARNVMYYLSPPDLSASPTITNIFDQVFNEEIDESSDDINYLETEQDLKDTEDIGQTTTIDLSADNSDLETLIVDISQDLPQIYYETSDEAYNDVVDTEDDSDVGVAITDSTHSNSTISPEEEGEARDEDIDQDLV